MEKYRLVRMNVVKYTDDEFILEQLLDEGYTLEPEQEPTDGAGGVDDKEPEQEPTDGAKKSTKSSKK